MSAAGPAVVSHPAIVPLPKDLGTCPRSLVVGIRAAVSGHGSWQDTATRVAGVLRRDLPGPDLLAPEQLAGDPSGYQTHLLHAEPDGSFSVTVMVWLPGQETCIHDHVTWCVTAVLQGTEYEELFGLRGDHLEVVARTAPDERHGRAENPVRAADNFLLVAGQAVAQQQHHLVREIRAIGQASRHVRPRLP